MGMKNRDHLRLPFRVDVLPRREHLRDHPSHPPQELVLDHILGRKDDSTGGELLREGPVLRRNDRTHRPGVGRHLVPRPRLDSAADEPVRDATALILKGNWDKDIVRFKHSSGRWIRLYNEAKGNLIVAEGSAEAGLSFDLAASLPEINEE